MSVPCACYSLRNNLQRWSKQWPRLLPLDRRLKMNLRWYVLAHPLHHPLKNAQLHTAPVCSSKPASDWYPGFRWGLEFISTLPVLGTTPHTGPSTRNLIKKYVACIMVFFIDFSVHLYIFYYIRTYVHTYVRTYLRMWYVYGVY